MEHLIDTAWRIYRSAVQSGNNFVVQPSIPILFFGDSERYFDSDLKIVTVALNPSRLEFPDDDRFLRFPAAGERYDRLKEGERHPEYVEALNDYFRVNPYGSWFDSYEKILEGMGASYYDDAENTALHTDLFSPLATDPTWSRLGKFRDELIDEGLGLWHDLMLALTPDLIIISVAEKYLEHIQFTQLGDCHLAYTVERKNPFQVCAFELRLVLGDSTTMVFGRAANKPFGTVSHKDKRKIGAALRRQLDGR